MRRFLATDCTDLHRFFCGEGTVISFRFSVFGYQFTVGGFNYYCLPARRLAPSLKQSTGLFFNARPGCGDWDADETDLLRKDTDKNGFFLYRVCVETINADFCPI